jgi:hypothetical protein
VSLSIFIFSFPDSYKIRMPEESLTSHFVKKLLVNKMVVIIGDSSKLYMYFDICNPLLLGCELEWSNRLSKLITFIIIVVIIIKILFFCLLAYLFVLFSNKHLFGNSFSECVNVCQNSSFVREM